MFWKGSREPLSFAVASENDSDEIPYHYVHVEGEGTVRELHSSERKYLETPYHPADGSRPYVMGSPNTQNPFGDLRGLCLRSKVPSRIAIRESPTEDPIPLHGHELREDTIGLARENGFEIVEEDGEESCRRNK